MINYLIDTGSSTGRCLGSGALTERGKHRSAGVTDLIVAVTAQANNTVVLHYDHDFETVAGITGQATQWIAAPGSIS